MFYFNYSSRFKLWLFGESSLSGDYVDEYAELTNFRFKFSRILETTQFTRNYLLLFWFFVCIFGLYIITMIINRSVCEAGNRNDLWESYHPILLNLPLAGVYTTIYESVIYFFVQFIKGYEIGSYLYAQLAAVGFFLFILLMYYILNKSNYSELNQEKKNIRKFNEYLDKFVNKQIIFDGFKFDGTFLERNIIILKVIQKVAVATLIIKTYNYPLVVLCIMTGLPLLNLIMLYMLQYYSNKFLNIKECVYQISLFAICGTFIFQWYNQYTDNTEGAVTWSSIFIGLLVLTLLVQLVVSVILLFKEESYLASKKVVPITSDKRNDIKIGERRNSKTVLSQDADIQVLNQKDNIDTAHGNNLDN